MKLSSKTKNILLITLSFHLIVISCSLYIMNMLNTNRQTQLQSKIQTLNEANVSRNKQIEILYKNSCTIIDSSVIVMDENENELLLLKEIGKTKKLILRFSEINCINCISDEIKLISKYPDLQRNTVYLATYKRQSDLIVAKRMLGIENTIYNISNKQFNCEDKEINIPHYFVVNEDKSTSHFFYPTLSDKESIEKYLKYISHLMK